MKISPFPLLALLYFLAIRCGSDSTSSVASNPTQAITPDSLQHDTLLGEPVKSVAFLKSYTGTIDGKHDIQMILTSWGDGYMTGRYRYKKTGKFIDLSGETVDGDHYKIIESTDGNETGLFSFKLDSPDSIRGYWLSKDGKRNLPFSVSAVPSDGDKTGWAGDWHLNEIWDSGILLVGNVSGSSFDFALTVVRSSHIGTLEGQAKIKGNKATYRLKDYEEEPCHLVFEHKGSFIQLTQESSNFACGFGARASATGKFERDFVERKATLSVGSGEEDVFPSQALHGAFKSFVGDKNYDTFAFNMQFKEKSASDPKDGLNAIVVTGFVQGLFTSNEAIIIVGKTGKFWAATIDFDQLNNEPLVRYFTNSDKFKQHLPKTIESWREGFKDYRVIF
jgi:hypothetical protein